MTLKDGKLSLSQREILTAFLANRHGVLNWIELDKQGLYRATRIRGLVHYGYLDSIRSSREVVETDGGLTHTYQTATILYRLTDKGRMALR